MADKNYGNNLQLAELIKYISDNMKFPLMGAGGGFAPIGTVAYFDGTTAPAGWLLCNGCTHNITDYPELAAYFASHHGRSNYYGGNGTTTFAVPTKKGMPGGEDNIDDDDFTISKDWGNTQEYYSSEKIVGVASNGKPIYKRSAKIYNSSGIGDSAIDWTMYEPISSSVEKVIKIYGSLHESSAGWVTSISVNSADLSYNVLVGLALSGTNAKKPTFSTKGISWVDYVIGTFYYTKTTDSAVSAGHSADGKGVFCIKATVAGDPNGHVYSTEEHVVGQWIDGKTLYEKTVTGTTASTAGIYKTLANLGTNCNLVKADGFVSDGVYGDWPVTYNGNNDVMVILMNYDGNNGVTKKGCLSHGIISGTAFLNNSITVTLQYTKS